MFQKSTFEVVRDEPGGFLVIRDTGHSDGLTVTNDADDVVKRLVKSGKLTEDKRLLYYDSDGKLDELLVENGEFNGFAPGPINYEP